jgi:hypothetical protein
MECCSAAVTEYSSTAFWLDCSTFFEHFALFIPRYAVCFTLSRLAPYDLRYLSFAMRYAIFYIIQLHRKLLFGPDEFGLSG